MIPRPTYSALTLRVGILGLNTTRGFAGASPSAAPNFTPASDDLRMAAPIAIGAEDTVAEGCATGDLLGPASTGGFVSSCAVSVTAGASVVPVGSVGAGASASCGCASTGGGFFVGLKTFLGGMPVGQWVVYARSVDRNANSCEDEKFRNARPAEG